MPDYARIYDTVFLHHPGYQSPMFSPGVRLCIEHAAALRQVGPRHLDFGCGAGFVVELMRTQYFRKDSYGVDISTQMVEAANQRMNTQWVSLVQNGRAPYRDEEFDLVTCFDVLEHLDPVDINHLVIELMRLVKPGGKIFCNISLRPAASSDYEGNNLHRTIEGPDWWNRQFAFDEYTVSHINMEMTGWKSK